MGEQEKYILSILGSRPTVVPSIGGASSGDRTWVPPDKAAARSAESERKAYRDLIKSGQDRIDQLSLEATLVGKTGVAADTYRFKLELLQNATAKGRTLDDHKLADIRRLTEAYGVAASKVAFLTTQEQLRFERDQMFRSPTEQRVYSTLRDTGLDVGSVQGQALANQIRFNESLRESRELAGDFAHTLVGGIMNGQSAMKAFESAALGALEAISDRKPDPATEALFYQGDAA